MLFLERIHRFINMESDHYPLTASTDFALTASSAETALRKEGFEFIQNRTKDLVEFEIEKPTYFRIVNSEEDEIRRWEIFSYLR